MQVCTLLQTDNHTSTPPLSFLQAGCPSCRPTNSVKALVKICNLKHGAVVVNIPCCTCSFSLLVLIFGGFCSFCLAFFLQKIVIYHVFAIMLEFCILIFLKQKIICVMLQLMVLIGFKI